MRCARAVSRSVWTVLPQVGQSPSGLASRRGMAEARTTRRTRKGEEALVKIEYEEEKPGVAVPAKVAKKPRHNSELNGRVKVTAGIGKKASAWTAPGTHTYSDAHGLLIQTFGKPKIRTEGNSRSACGRKRSVLEAAVSIILSQNTSNINSGRALASLNEAFPGGPEQILEASEDEVEVAIRCGGLSKMKAGRIQSLLQQVKSRNAGELSLEHLRSLPTAKAKAELMELKGLGPKSVACILAFTLDREDLAVDTHEKGILRAVSTVHRVANRLGWVPPKSSAEKTYNFLSEQVPDPLKREMHILMINLGQQVCNSKQPNCKACPLSSQCAHNMGCPTTSSNRSIAQTSKVPDLDL